MNVRRGRKMGSGLYSGLGENKKLEEKKGEIRNGGRVAANPGGQLVLRGGRCSFFLTMQCFNDAMFCNS